MRSPWTLLTACFLLFLPCTATNSSNVAIIVSAVTSHFDQVAFYAFHLRKLGLEVHAWLHPYAFGHYDGVVNAFIKPHVDKVEYLGVSAILNQSLPIPASYRILVYTTMSQKKEDMSLLQMLGLHDTLYERAERVVMATYQPHAIASFASFCPAPKCTVVLSGYRPYQQALHTIHHERIRNVNIIPVFYVFRPQYPRNLPNKFLKAVETSFTAETRIIAIQGRMNILHRRYDMLFNCMDRIREDGVDLRLVSIGKSYNVDVPDALRKYVITLDSLPYDQYYTTLSKAEFIVTFPNTRQGIEPAAVRAATAINNALMANVPVILTRNISAHYPCLRTSPWHRTIFREDDCHSLQTALKLTKLKLLGLKEEVTICQQQWILAATKAMKQVIEGRVSSNL